jgi:hypothetical protein
MITSCHTLIYLALIPDVYLIDTQAGFDPDAKQRYIVARAVEVPEVLAAQVFPWVDDDLAWIKQVKKINPRLTLHWLP